MDLVQKVINFIFYFIRYLFALWNKRKEYESNHGVNGKGFLSAYLFNST